MVRLYGRLSQSTKSWPCSRIFFSFKWSRSRRNHSRERRCHNAVRSSNNCRDHCVQPSKRLVTCSPRRIGNDGLHPANTSPRTYRNAFRNAATRVSSLVLDNYLQLNPDCTSQGMPTVFVTSAPSHGSVAIQKNVESYPNFEPTNQRSDCNDKETASVGILYTSEKTFIDVDRFTVHSVSKFGQLLIRDYVVTVEHPHIAEPARAQP